MSPTNDGAVEVWTDGGCQGNPGPGGWAFVIRRGGAVLERSGFEPATTNNRMELTAVIRALREIASAGQAAAGGGPAGGAPAGGGPAVGAPAGAVQVVVHTDSQYVQKGITEWIHAWSRNGWKTSAKKPVKNAELWTTLLDLSRGLAISWQWVLGHAGNELNERCDALVQEAIASGLNRGG